MTNLLSPTVCQKIDEWNKRYPEKKQASGVMQALRYVQEANGGSLNEALLDAVAAYLKMPEIAVYEVASFYSLYNLKPVGRHLVSVCTNISCMLRGSEEILNCVKKRLGIEVNETTADGKFTLYEVECLAACVGAPMFQIDKKYYENLTPEKVDEILGGLS